MAKGQSYSRYQQGIINRYYEHKDTILSTKLGEIVTDLYLAETDKKKQQLWTRVQKALEGAKLKPAQYATILEKRDIEALAKLVSELAG